ncbi:MAG: PilZ domain-containing protein [Candidatus Marinimicrobia bacterium]|nr:PilZ domain-containing protein [Candidatus Neomarinimicrobiota bacterium]
MDKRSLKRNLLLRPVKIFSQISHKHIGNIVDIHTEGMKIVTKYHFNPDEIMHLLINIPDLNEPIHEIELKAKNVWTKDFILNRYQCGLKFHDISPETKIDLVNNLIQKYGFTA